MPDRSRLIYRILTVAALLWSGHFAPPPAGAQPAPVAGKKFAFLVGVEIYEHASLRELKYAGDDVSELAALLGKSGYESVVLTAETGARDGKLVPNKANIESQLRDVLRKCKSTDLILLGFAGHGLQFAGSPDAYFCPVDARPFADETASMVSMATIYAELEKSFAGVKIMLVDACRDDPNPSRGRGIDADSAPPPPRGVAALFSCSSGQKAYESDELKHGVFFHHVLRGLEGRAADVETGEITFDLLSAHVRNQVPRDVTRLVPGQRQFPNLKADLIGIPPVLAKVARSPVVVPQLPVNPAPNAPQNSPPSGGNMASGGRQPPDGAPEITNSLDLKLKLIQAGEFLMGSPADEKDRSDDEGPQHRVKISQPFYLGVHEVTKGQFGRFVTATNYKTDAEKDGKGGYGLNAAGSFEQDPKYTWRNAGFAQGDDHPVVNVSWNDATAFCEWLSKQEGKMYKLPTEAQWEYACRAGTSTPFHFGSVNNGNQANIDGNYPYAAETQGPYLKRTASVGSYPANTFGLFDMHGNVGEWCLDGYDANAYKNLGNLTSSDPVNTSAVDRRVLRGGSWFFVAGFSRSAFRGRFSPDFRYGYTGFRVSRTP